MLQIQNICKQYTTGKLVQHALDDVSLNLRDNEFVAILGPSGSGKTTLLNIIGGLDRYDSGDLIINGISTKEYKDRDWDSYRNHTIGFVFQSYNLIPHQTILSNVELALTISGIDKSKRRQMAVDALTQIGLGEQIEKRPNQLSGGQMQRVAIARALVNDPDILLADEPTGALDSDTSIQVMDLLKEVAKDRLVVMVTHNPELAEQYATRIVNLRDGKIRSDSDPYEPGKSEILPPRHENMGKSSMSFLTALALSFNNLRTKKARTLLTSFAGSIGIIGIALILALSTGVNNYIQTIEEETLSEYPLQIESTGFDLSSMMVSASGASDSGSNSDKNKDEKKDQVNVLQMVTNMFSTMDSNDLKSLKSYLDDNKAIKKYTKAVEYSYNVAPQIYRVISDSDSATTSGSDSDADSGSESNSESASESTSNTDKKIRQVHPDTSFQSLGLGSSTGANSMMSSMMSTDVFFQLPEDSALYEKQYDIKAGRWPKKYNECVVVLSSDGSISDFMLYTLGLRDSRELDDMIRQFMNEEPVTTPENLGTYSYDDILNAKFKLIQASDRYQYDAQYQVWRDKSEDSEYMENLVANGEDLNIVGIVAPSEDAKGTFLNMGIYYPASLTKHVVEEAKNSEIIKQQLANRNTNIFTNEPFGSDSEENGFNMDSLFTIDTNALTNSFTFDNQALAGLGNNLDLTNAFQIDDGALDLSGLVNMGQIDLTLPEMPGMDLSSILDGVRIDATPENVAALSKSMLEGYQNYYAGNTAADYAHLTDYFLAYLKTDEAREILKNNLKDILSSNGNVTTSSEQLKNLVADVMSGFQSFASEKGYTDPDHFNDYFQEYLETAQARSVLDRWAGTNFQVADDITITDAQLQKLATELAAGYQDYAARNNYPNPAKMGDYFSEYLQTEDAANRLTEGISKMIDTDALKTQLTAAIQQYMNTVFQQYGAALSTALEAQISSAMQQIMNQLASGMEQVMTQAFSQLGDQLQNAFQIDGSAFANAFSMNMTGDDLAELMLSMNSYQTASYDSNLSKLGYVDFAVPDSINIYPKDFESKEHVVSTLDDYNKKMEKEGKDDQVITYTDMVGTLMSSVTDIIDIISYVLIAFVAISLVVSSIMIGVITYISVLERKKEIGILRAIGASKHNISQVFNAETCIIGLGAGLLGIGISLLLLIPGNALIHHLADNTQVNAVLPVVPAIVLILLSVFLTLLGGLIPAKKAAKSDPVAALRSE